MEGPHDTTAVYESATNVYYENCECCGNPVENPSPFADPWEQCGCPAGQERIERERASRLKATPAVKREQQPAPSADPFLARLRAEGARDQRKAALEDRELAIREHEATRKERRYFTNGGGEGLAAFIVPFDFDADTERLPAVVERQDGETVLYAGKLNSIFGVPGSGKSWIALIAAHEAVLRGGRVLYLDYEDNAATFKRRALLVGFHPQDYADAFQYAKPGLMDSPVAVAEAVAWLADAPDVGQNLVIIDAAESAGCPSDGSDVSPWYSRHVNPWQEVGCGVLTVDHVPKQREDRPMGAIGSQHKLARITGAALAVSGVAWTKRTNGTIFLHNHKDRGGDLPAAVGKCVAVVSGTWKGQGDARGFGYAIEVPTQEEAEDMNISILHAIQEEGGVVVGKRKLRDLVQGKNDSKDSAIKGLVQGGFIEKGRAGQSDTFAITTQGIKLLDGGVEADT